jgi:hypothetical protein
VEEVDKAKVLLEKLLGVFFKERSLPIFAASPEHGPTGHGKIQGSTHFIACGLYFDIVMLKMPEAFSERLPRGLGNLHWFL